MGFGIRASGAIRIEEDQQAAALAAVKRLTDAAVAAALGKNRYGRRKDFHYGYVDDDAFARARTLQEVFDAWRWLATFERFEATDDGNGRGAGAIVGIQFTGENAGDDDLLFDVLAPYIAGGTITIVGEDGSIEKWEFADGVRTLHLANGTVRHCEPKRF